MPRTDYSKALGADEKLPNAPVEAPKVVAPPVEPKPADDVTEAQEAPVEVVEVEEPTVEIILDPDFPVDPGTEEIKVSVAGLDPAADYTDDHNRVTVSASPLEVPASVADALLEVPAVATPAEVELRKEADES